MLSLSPRLSLKPLICKSQICMSSFIPYVHIYLRTVCSSTPPTPPLLNISPPLWLHLSWVSTLFSLTNMILPSSVSHLSSSAQLSSAAYLKTHPLPRCYHIIWLRQCLLEEHNTALIAELKSTKGTFVVILPESIIRLTPAPLYDVWRAPAKTNQPGEKLWTHIGKQEFPTIHAKHLSNTNNEGVFPNSLKRQPCFLYLHVSLVSSATLRPHVFGSDQIT